MDSIADLINEENDILYRRGFQKGIIKIETQFVTSLLLGTDLPITKIASLAGVTENFVKKVKKTLH